MCNIEHFSTVQKLHKFLFYCSPRLNAVTTSPIAGSLVWSLASILSSLNFVYTDRPTTRSMSKASLTIRLAESRDALNVPRVSHQIRLQPYNLSIVAPFVLTWDWEHAAWATVFVKFFCLHVTAGQCQMQICSSENDALEWVMNSS